MHTKDKRENKIFAFTFLWCLENLDAVKWYMEKEKTTYMFLSCFYS